MALFITSLNSGSNGNCYYIGNETEAVLIDAGISCRETERRMQLLELSMEKVRAVFITHEHADHINGIKTLSKKYQLPVYITTSTQKLGRVHLEKNLIHRFKADDIIQIGGLAVKAFQKAHDAADPHSFMVSDATTRIGIFTDIGIVCKQLTHHFKQCHAAFLEANYDEDMLMNGGYPYFLKKRITDGKGHLSNMQALELFKKHRPSFMSHLILSHLSENNNDPKLVSQLFHKHSNGISIVIASRHEPTEVFTINNGMRLVRKRKEYKTTAPDPQQLSLF